MDFIKSSFVPNAGILVYCLHPLSIASFLYSISSSTRASECSDTNAIGTKTICFPIFEFSTITLSVEGPIHFNGPTLL